MGLDITKLKLEIGEVEDAMSELNRKMQEHNDTQIQTFGDKLDIAQKFDLRWAIGGLVVSFAGAMWGLGA